MIRAILLAVILLILIAAVVLVTHGRAPRDAAVDRRLSGAATTGLVVLGMVAIGVAVILGFTAGGSWPLLPIGVWVGIYLVTLTRARTRPQRERAKLEQRRQAARGRIDEFGADGAALLDQADAAIDRINSTEAVEHGWLGALDFTADTEMITDTLRQIAALRNASDEWAALPNATTDNETTIRDAQRVIGELKEAAAERARILHDCAVQAEEVDNALRRQREQDAVEQRRDDIRSRLSTLLTGAALKPNAEPSEATELVQSRVAAFHELKETIERHRHG